MEKLRIGDRVIDYNNPTLTRDQFKKLDDTELTQEEIGGIIAAVERGAVEVEEPFQPGVITPSVDEGV